MKDQMQLPDDLMIDYMIFCKLIAQAICPASEQKLKGIDCITGKLVTINASHPKPIHEDGKWAAIATEQLVLLSDDGRTLNQLREDQLDDHASSTPALPFGGELRQYVHEVMLPHKLTNEDRQLLETLLLKLPPLHYPMSEKEVGTFVGAWVDLLKRPDWKPILVTAMEIEQRQAKQHTIMLHHQKALQDELTHGRVVALDSNHVPVARFAMGTYLPRDQAIAYLNRCGILHSDKPVGDRRDVESPAPAVQLEPLDEQGPIGKRKLSDKQRQEVVTLRNELQRAGVKDFRQQVATKFGISTRRVQTIVAEENAKKNEVRIENLVVKKRK